MTPSTYTNGCGGPDGPGAYERSFATLCAYPAEALLDAAGRGPDGG
ncbi:hypothetical protein [Micromonospora maritima]|nr:hypothetical protein [Micromonospora maritima]